MPGTLIVSPHLDDALLSATQVAMSGPSTVATVFAGPPPAEVELTEWDLLTGASSSLERYRERLVEDERANAVVGSRPVHLAFPEAQFRQGQLDAASCTAELTALMAEAETVWLPTGVGGHPDHVLARKLALAALPDEARPAVGFYGDFPYIASYGWPNWVTGTPTEEYLDAAAWLSLEFLAVGLPDDGLVREVITLSDAEREVKAATIGEYRSQLPGLRLDPIRIGRLPHALDYEVRWTPTPEVLDQLVRESRASVLSGQ
jgi:LmbE family N-acetylglucosaminyl deacetylase